ncbi:peptidoglycan-binding protein [Streptomyces sp. 8N706]|uniref:peptidoglycan-binding protein n=1 Tax=Streptomyces sp. 8N706 TaxID=3457416 RepID=UPI003FD61F9B
MSRWKELPEPLDPRVRQLIVQLRRLKDRSGLSLASLGSKTSYSRSSWERYLNGKKLPPREAVEQLARVCGGDVTRLLVLHEVAEETRAREVLPDRGPAPEPTGPEPSGPEPSGPEPSVLQPSVPEPSVPESSRPESAWRRSMRHPVAAAIAGAVLVGGPAGGLLVAAPWEDGAEPRPTASAARNGAPGRPFITSPGRTFRCEIERVDGHLQAGHSTTRDAVLVTSVANWDVVEAQCLLRHLGFSPGAIDGVYGAMTERAVKRFQKKSRLIVDGKVGPHTWGALRA